MKNGELEKLLTPPEIISDQHKDNIIKLNEYNNKLKIYLVENYFKKPDILLIYLKKMGAEKIISISENIELLHRIFSNIVFFDYFKESELCVADLIKILTICNNSSEYFINRIKNEEEIINKKIKKLEVVFKSFIDNAEELYDFEFWFNDRAIKNLGEILNIIAPNDFDKEEELLNLEIGDKIKSLVVFEKIFENYYQDVKNMYESKRELNPKEKNININYFVRELRNIFESGNKIEIPNEIICELVSLIFDKQMDDTQLNNILKNSNKNISNTSYTLQFTTKENNIEEREYIKTKNCL